MVITTTELHNFRQKKNPSEEGQVFERLTH